MTSLGRGSDVVAARRDLSPIDVCLMIDDNHQLAGQAAHAVLGDIIRHLPSNGHLVLSGRAEADVPLARLRVTGGCVEISEEQLAFTPAEERSLARLLDVPQPRGRLAGWPALVRLALTSPRTLAQQFLWEEIVGNLRPVEARALLALAMIGWGDSASVVGLRREGRCRQAGREGPVADRVRPRHRAPTICGRIPSSACSPRTRSLTCCPRCATPCAPGTTPCGWRR